MRYGGNMRLFEAAGCGVFQLTDDLPGTHQWFAPGETIVTYTDRDDLRRQVMYYLAHADERRAIAQAAQDHVYAHHTYDQRMQVLVDLVS
ncbi:MAG: glycosyltransferase family 1 protein, partial [Chloroflexi bacterium]|nr:glycosyltransferase family 1 protein [Chloroflexota bacterium]